MEIGALILLPPVYKQGYYWKPGMPEPLFCDNSKKLPNDVIWMSNADFDHAKEFGRYIKNDRFLRVPAPALLRELGAADVSPGEQSMALGMAMARLIDSAPNELRQAGTLSQAFAMGIPERIVAKEWEVLGTEAKSYFWKGSVKHKLLLGGNACAPRYEYNFQLLKCSILDLVNAPEVVKFRQEKSAAETESLWHGKGGFARVRIENVKQSVMDFVSLDRTLITINELKWLMTRATVTVKALYLCPLMKHPLLHKSHRTGFQPFSWLDGLRMEALYYAPGSKNPGQEAWLRGNAHLAMAFYAEYLTAAHDVGCLSITHGKIGIACSASEVDRVKLACHDSGVWTDLTLDPY